MKHDELAAQLRAALARLDPDDAYRGFCIVAHDNREVILTALRASPEAQPGAQAVELLRDLRQGCAQIVGGHFNCQPRQYHMAMSGVAERMAEKIDTFLATQEPSR